MTRYIVTWTEELSAFVSEQFLDGYSASVIAKQLTRKLDRNVTRNAVIGRLHRMGVHRPTATRPVHTTPRPRKASAVDEGRAHAALQKIFAPKTPFRPGKLPENVVAIQTSWPAKLLADMKAGECRKPRADSDPGPGRMDETLYCAAPIPVDERYCPACRKQMYRRALSPEQRRKLEERAEAMRAAKVAKRRAA